MTSSSPSESGRIEPAELAKESSWIGWLPISILPLIAIACRNLLPPWAFMWILSFTIFISLKWLSWWKARKRIAHAAWRSIQGDPHMWHAHFMQVPGLPEKLVDGRQADYFSYFFQVGRFTQDEVSHYVKAYGTLAQLHAVFEMYRAFPENARFNQSQRKPNEVPLFLGAGEGSPFAKLVPKIAEGLRAHGCTHVETGLIPGAVHYVVEDQPVAVADLIGRIASMNTE